MNLFSSCLGCLVYYGWLGIARNLEFGFVILEDGTCGDC